MRLLTDTSLASATRTGRVILTASILACLTACSGIEQPLKSLGKSDIDQVSDTHIRILRNHIQDLALKLYEENPGELKKVPGMSLEARMAQILNHPTDVLYRDLDYKRSVRAIQLAFNSGYSGDRVFALLLGVSSMLKLSYDDRDELFLFDELDPQKLYDSARNLEKIIQRLRAETNRGTPWLDYGASPGLDGVEDKLSRMISIQDLMAEIIVSKTQRIINKAVHGATGFFIPIGI